MISSRTFVTFSAVSALLALALMPPAVAQSGAGLVKRYEMIELKVEGDGQSRAYALNDTAQVIGWIEVEGTRRSAHWHNLVTTDLHGTVHFNLRHPYNPTLLFDEDYSEAYDISNADQIVGTARTQIKCPDASFVMTNAFLLRPAVLTDLATPYPGDALTNLGTFDCPCLWPDSAATGISNANHVVGWSDRNHQIIRAFLARPVNGQWVQIGPCLENLLLIDLGTLKASDPVSSATAVNDSGVVTGYSYTINEKNLAAYHGFVVGPDESGVWFVDAGDGVNARMKDLHTLGGTNSWGRDINNRGQVVGESDVDITSGGSTVEHYTHAFLVTPSDTNGDGVGDRWFEDGGGRNVLMQDLATLRTDRTRGFSAASAINDSGVVVGWAENDKRERRAFIYENGQMKDLNDLLHLIDADGKTIIPGIVLTEARDINEDGIIVGWGVVRGTSGNKTRGFLLNPVMVDPNALQPADPNQPGTGTGAGATTPPGSGSGFSGEPIFGTPQHMRSDQDTEPNQTGGGAVQAPVPVLCGFGTLTVLPVMLVGWGWLRASRRKAA